MVRFFKTHFKAFIISFIFSLFFTVNAFCLTYDELTTGEDYIIYQTNSDTPYVYIGSYPYYSDDSERKLIFFEREDYDWLNSHKLIPEIETLARFDNYYNNVWHPRGYEPYLVHICKSDGVYILDNYLITRSEYEKNISEEEPGDTVDDERIKKIEDKLNELGIAFDKFSEKYDLEKMQKEEISDKLDTLIILLDDKLTKLEEVYYAADSDKSYFELLYDDSQFIKNTFDNEYNVLRKFYSMTYRDEWEYQYHEDDVTLFENINKMSEEITNSLTATNEKTLSELNDTLLITNKFLSMLFVLLLVLIAMISAIFVGKQISNIINRNVY